MLNKDTMLELLHQDVIPALGCTEPVCVALCVANAAKIAEGKIIGIEVETNGGIYKNGMSAGIPNCQEVGLNYAAALGAALKNPERKLEVLADITEETLAQMNEWIDAGIVQVKLNEEENDLYVKCLLRTELGEAVCVIRHDHTNVVLLSKNEEVLLSKEVGANGEENPLIASLKGMTIAQMRAVVDMANEAELEFLLDGVAMNEALAAYSETNTSGVGIAAALRQERGSALLNEGLLTRIMLKVSSAAESRLDGCPLPTMSSSGSGTKGIVVILPVNETADTLGVAKVQKLRAIALAHLVNRYVNAYVGKLSPMCTCIMGASTGVAVGITYLLGGNDDQLGYAVKNMTGTVSGMICDGGKVGCSLKAATGSAAALLSAITAIHQAPLRTSDGICGATPEECIQNATRIGNQGMSQTNQEILKIMLEKQQ